MSGRKYFGLTENAKVRILEMLNQMRSKVGDDAIPSIMWIDSSSSIETSRVAIGIYHSSQRQDIADDIVNDGGFQYVLAVSNDDLFNFYGKVIDFNGGQFCLK